MAKYLLELMLPHASMLAYAPSLQAAAAVFVAREIYAVGGWTPTLAYYTGYAVEQLHHCVTELQLLVRDAADAPLQAVQKKWNHTRFFHLSECAEIKAYAAALKQRTEL
jgi:hypothetical protein